MSKFKMNTVYIAITNDLNYLAHYGVPGQEWYVNKAERYQNHAKYAKYDKRYKDSYMQAAKERMNQKHLFSSDKYDKMTFSPLPEPPIESINELKRLDGSKSIKAVRNAINHPQDGTEGVPDAERGYNCPNCALAFEMTERGYDVIARPKLYRSNVENVEYFFKDGKLTPVVPKDNPFNIMKNFDAWQAASGDSKDRARKQYWDSVNKAAKDCCNKANEMILAQGNGARGIIVQGFMASENPYERTTAYHAFNYKVENGKVRFYDVQGRNPKQQNGGSGLDEDAIDPRELYIIRTDNLQLSPFCTRGVYSNRGIKY